MDRKSITILVVSFILLMAWYPLVVNRLYPPKPLPPGSTNTLAYPDSTNATTARTSTPPATITGTQSVPSLAEAPAGERAPFVPPPGATEQLLELTNANRHFTFSSFGGGIKQIELLEYPNAVTARYQTSTNQVAMLNAFTRSATLAVLDGETVQGDGLFTLSRTAEGVRAEKLLSNGLHIVKEFIPGTNYLLSATVRLENRSSTNLPLPQQYWVVGTATPMNPGDDGQKVGAMWYNGSKTADVGAPYFADRNWACMPRVPPPDFRAGESNVVWAAVHNQFFALAAMPSQPAQAFIVHRLHLPSSETALVATNNFKASAYEAALVYPAQTLAPGQSVERQFQLFAGPKEYQTLARIAGRFNNNLDLIMGFGGFFGFFAKGLLLAMNWLHNSLSFSYAAAIIAITIVIKLLFWPLTQASTRSMKRMQELQPQMKALQEKYKDDPTKMNRKLMEFMKENKVSPLGGCLPMLLQIPVFFGFYMMIQSAIELRGASFLWISDLSQPDTLFYIPGTSFPFNLLPLIMGATMLWQARLTPPSPGMDPAQAAMMRYMPLMFMVFLYNFSAGLTLYWTVQNLLTIAQTKLTRTKPAAAPPSPPGPAAAKAALTGGPKKKK